MTTSSKEYMAEYFQKNKDKIYERRRARGREDENQRYYETYRERHRRKGKEHDQAQKLQVFTHYSGGEPRCAHCGIVDVDVLTLDHINGNGHQHRKSIGGHPYRWIINNDYPDGFQVLCFNCNWKKRLNSHTNTNL